MKKYKEKISTIVVITVFAIIVLLCVGSVIYQKITENKEKAEFAKIESIVTDEYTDTNNTTERIKNPVILKNSAADKRSEVENTYAQTNYDTLYYKLYFISELILMNSECFGWISILNTNINYPVMHTPNNPQKYLNKNYYGEYNQSGTPFLDSRCSADSTNLIIYGHHMNIGTMFADLCNYTDYSYFSEHPTVVLETKSGAYAYFVFSVIKVKSDGDWYKFLTTDLDKTYEKWISYAKTNSLYNTEITLVCGQQILTLSTCYGYNQDNRILVLAVRN